MGGYLKALLTQENVAFVPLPLSSPPYEFPNPTSDMPSDDGTMVIHGSGIVNAKAFGSPVMLYIEIEDSATGGFHIALGDRAAASALTVFKVGDDGSFSFVTTPDGANFSSIEFGSTADINISTNSGAVKTVSIQSGPTDLLSFYQGISTPGVAQQTITGMKLAADVVMANLLTALHALGLIVDATT